MREDRPLYRDIERLRAHFASVKRPLASSVAVN
jgi:hypothetical protein